MGAIKLREIGSSQGFLIPKGDLVKLGFSKDDEYELVVGERSISIFKKRAHHSEWHFPESELPSDDQAWIDADLSGSK